jgi:ribonuclease III
MDIDLLQQAFAHGSWVREQSIPGLESNQRLEFLGDAVLELFLAEYLYHHLPGLPEGQLTRLKAVVARSATLARIARQTGLGDYLLLGRGEEETGGRQKASLLADSVEALIGAVYVAKGLRSARALVMRLFGDSLAALDDQSHLFDHKTALQELVQRHTKQIPRYATIGTHGPPHDRVFEVEARFQGQGIGRGEGRSKQDAQQAAAGDALAGRAVWLPLLSSSRPDGSEAPEQGA